MIMKTIYDLVMNSELLKKDVDKFACENRIKTDSAEYESYKLGYVRAVEDMYAGLAVYNHLILNLYDN